MDATEIADVYGRYGYIVLRVCREIMRNEQDAQDAMQDTFLKFWKYAEQLRDKTKILSSLKRTAVSCSIDALRSRKRQGKYDGSWHELREALSDENTENRFSRRLQRELISLLFESVRADKDSLQMVYLYYFDEMTLEEVATTTGFSRRAVGMKMERFRQQAFKFCNNNQIEF